MSNSTHNRPLSIISEHDVDDLDITTGNKTEQRAATGGKGKSPGPKTAKEASQDFQVHLAQTKSPKSKKPRKTPKGQKKTQQMTTTFSPQTQTSGNKPPASASKPNSAKKHLKISPTHLVPQATALPNCSSKTESVDLDFECNRNKDSANQPQGNSVISCRKETKHGDVACSLLNKNLVPIPSSEICTEKRKFMKQTEINKPLCGTVLDDLNCNGQGCADSHCLSEKDIISKKETIPKKETVSKKDISRKETISQKKTISKKDILSNDKMQHNDMILVILPETNKQTKQTEEKPGRSIPILPLITSTDPYGNRSPRSDRRVSYQDKNSRTLDEVNNNRGQVIPEITIALTEDTPHPSISIFSLRDDIANSSQSKLLANICSKSDISSSNFTKDKNINITNVGINSHNSTKQSVINQNCSYSNSKRPKTKLHFSSIKSAESSASLLDCEQIDSDGRALDSLQDVPIMNLSDFWKLKETTEKLRLSTRRPSTMLWRQQFMEGEGLSNPKPNLNDDDGTDERMTSDRKQRIDEALDRLRNELQEMRSQDQNLARQLLTIRHEIHQLKLQRCTEEHHELIEDFQSELDDLQDFSDVLDFPPPTYGDNPLKHIGVTRLNISARRFSAC